MLVDRVLAAGRMNVEQLRAYAQEREGDRSWRRFGRVDLAWPELKLAVEYDGLDHVGSARRMNDDRRRLNRLVAAGWTVLHVTAPRLRDDLPGLIAEIRATIRIRRAA